MINNSHLSLDPGIRQAEQLPTDFTVDSQEMSPQAQLSNEAFAVSLNEIAVNIPEVEESREAIQAAGAELIESFGIKPELFEAPFRSMIFTSISSRLAKLNEGEPQPSDRQEKEFIADATLLLAQRFTDDYPDLRASLDEGDNPNQLSEDGIEAIYDKYTDTEHSKAVAEAIKGGLLDDVKKRMNITDENESPYDVRVLSISSGTMDTYGLFTAYPELPDGWTDLPKDERDRLIRDAEDYANSGSIWSEGLEKRSKDMKDSLGSEGTAPAWVTTVNGRKQLCISLPLAEKILYKDEVTSGTPRYSDKDYEHDFAVLEHEFTHTQEGFIDPALGIDFGVSIEELRAEHFSGNKAGYGDVKSFFSDLALLTGEHVVDAFDEAENKGRDPVEILKPLANQVGIDRIVELMAVVPKNYAEEQSNAVRKGLHAHVGGYDGMLEKLYAERVARGEKDLIAQRIEKRAKRLLELNYDFWVPEQYAGYQHMRGTKFLQKEMMEEIDKQRKTIYKDKIKTVNFKK